MIPNFPPDHSKSHRLLCDLFTWGHYQSGHPWQSILMGSGLPSMRLTGSRWQGPGQWRSFTWLADCRGREARASQQPSAQPVCSVCSSRLTLSPACLVSPPSPSPGPCVYFSLPPPIATAAAAQHPSRSSGLMCGKAAANAFFNTWLCEQDSPFGRFFWPQMGQRLERCHKFTLWVGWGWKTLRVWGFLRLYPPQLSCIVLSSTTAVLPELAALSTALGWPQSSLLRREAASQPLSSHRPEGQSRQPISSQYQRCGPIRGRPHCCLPAAGTALAQLFWVFWPQLQG